MRSPYTPGSLAKLAKQHDDNMFSKWRKRAERKNKENKMVRKSLPYINLTRNNPELNHKRVEAELERYRKFQVEAEEKGMELQPTLEGYRFIHKTDNSKNYFMPSGRINASAIAKDLIPIQPLPAGALPTYDRDIDVAAEVLPKVKRRRFDVIDRAVQKAREEIKEAENMSDKTSEKLSNLTDELRKVLKNDTSKVTKIGESSYLVGTPRPLDTSRFQDPFNPFNSNYNGEPIGPDSFGGSDYESHYMSSSISDDEQRKIRKEDIQRTIAAKEALATEALEFNALRALEDYEKAQMSIDEIHEEAKNIKLESPIEFPVYEPPIKHALDTKATEELRAKIKEQMKKPNVMEELAKGAAQYLPPDIVKFIFPTVYPAGINPEPIREAVTVIQQFGDMLKNQEVSELDPSGWIQLYSGRKFFPMDPKAEDMDIEDIAHSLSNMCRFTGHCKSFYSVAQHSVLVSHLVGGHALWGLLHDASEAYLVDMPRPVKRLKELEIFRTIEHGIQLQVCKKFGLQPNEPPIVKQADTKMLATEARDLMAPLHPEWLQPCAPLPFRIDPLPPAEAKKLFLDRYRELVGE